MRGPRRRAELARQAAEIEAVRPYLDLAREIHEEVSRAAGDGPGIEAVSAAIEAIPARERARVARQAFDRLPPDRQWEIIERLYGDAEIRGYLADERAARQAIAERAARHGELVRAARAGGRLDAGAVPAGARLTLGLFREADAAAARARGHRAAGAARRLVLRARGDGRFQVIEDLFDPDGSYFVTGDYDRATWETDERLAGHAEVGIGAAVEAPGGPRFEPALYPGGRVDVEVDGRIRQGRLHLGFAMLDERDVFTDE